jgi:carboxyl-terminal processing protease
MQRGMMTTANGATSRRRTDLLAAEFHYINMPLSEDWFAFPECPEIMQRLLRKIGPWIALPGAVVAIMGAVPASSLQGKKKYETVSNQQAVDMLNTIEADIKEHYYDARMRGLDLDKRFDRAREEINHAKSQDEAFLDIAGALAALQDSHTRFIPPVRPYGVDYGWVVQAVGDADCFVTAVRPESDAAQKGIRPGDQVLSINGVTVGRQNISYVEYGYNIFPQAGLRLALRSPDGVSRTILAMAKVIPGQEIVRHSDLMAWLRQEHQQKDRSRYFRVGNDTLAWKLPDFLIDPAEVDGLLNKAHSFQNLVLDLRGNPGGLRSAMDKFIGGFFQKDINVGEMREQKQSQQETAKSRGNKAFTGKLIVLIDSRSGSAAEIFARVVQLEKRGTVLGDRSAGAVGEGKDYLHAVNLDATNVAQYRARITVAALIMSDGNSLEAVGVTPDERVLPTPADLAAGRDPALARALELTGHKITNEEAGRIFPFEWPKEQMPEID